MSVLIRVIDMPENCDVCMFSDWSNLHQTAACKICKYVPCFDDFSREYLSKRANFCPLVAELPSKHGRLFDEDEVKNVYMDFQIAKINGVQLLYWNGQ